MARRTQALSRQPDATLRFDELLYQLRWKLHYMHPPPPLWSAAVMFGKRTAGSCWSALRALRAICSSRTLPTPSPLPKVVHVGSTHSSSPGRSTEASFAWGDAASSGRMSRMSDRAIQMEVGLIMQRCTRLASPRLASPRPHAVTKACDPVA